MEKFQRGTVVYFKVGKEALGVAIDQKDGKVFVRIPNYEVREYYPEELLTEQEYKQKREDYYNSLPKPEAINYGI